MAALHKAAILQSFYNKWLITQDKRDAAHQAAASNVYCRVAKSLVAQFGYGTDEYTASSNSAPSEELPAAVASTKEV
jgi:hypothetical protein